MDSRLLDLSLTCHSLSVSLCLRNAIALARSTISITQLVLRQGQDSVDNMTPIEGIVQAEWKTHVSCSTSWTVRTRPRYTHRYNREPFA
ncbi:hypothetical protein AMS68_007221 [Peltaster fructicola]|uniref:Uncharacterized protein n=1 Tax=Peltaster fructicola TaxID=286661 RepID=A0A6H0Y3W7_9PEZI|nr:hypothetical protein AMS68_007221 [Peltaster fructicola]